MEKSEFYDLIKHFFLMEAPLLQASNDKFHGKSVFLTVKRWFTEIRRNSTNTSDESRLFSNEKVLPAVGAAVLFHKDNTISSFSLYERYIEEITL